MVNKFPLPSKSYIYYPCDDDDAEACALDEAPPKPPPLCVFVDALDKAFD